MTDLRHQLIVTARHMAAQGLNNGSSGNLSARAEHPGGEQGFLITPTGMDYAAMQPADIVFMSLAGTPSGARQPSSEWRFHRDLYVAHPQAAAVLHAHSPFATSIACLRRDIPPFHYMIARFGGNTVRCAAYATFGSQALSDAALTAIAGRCGCLLANHGMLVYGSDLPQALALGSELETLCEQYWRACAIGNPVLLDDDEMATVLKKFERYGQPA